MVSKRIPFGTQLDVKTPLGWTSTVDIKAGKIPDWRIQRKTHTSSYI
jgi:hypothetical protein